MVGLLPLLLLIRTTAQGSLREEAKGSLPPTFNVARVLPQPTGVRPGYPLRIVTWNIDHGQSFDAITKEIQQLSPDIATLQEVDQNTERAGSRDVAADLGRSTHMNVATAIEFQELSQGHDGHPAYIGQATLSRLPIRSARVLRFVTQSGFWKPRSWIPQSVPLLQRRLGNRVALVTELDFNGELLVVYNVHFESRSFAAIQMAQLDEVFADFAAHYPPSTPVILAGDLNSKYVPARYLHRLNAVGFQSANSDRIQRTHRIAMCLDWVFAHNLPPWAEGGVEYEAQGSDHYPVSARLSR